MGPAARRGEGMSIGVSMHNWMRPEPIDRTIDRLGQLGYDGIEISGEPAQHDVARVRELLDAHGSECQAHAEAVGVRIGLEPLNRFETYFLNNAEQALALADDVGGDCGVALDMFHMNIEEADWAAAIRACEGRLVDFHVADNTRMPPGQGSFDWPAIVRELAGIGYEGHLTVEFVPSADRTPISRRTDIGDVS